MAYVDSNKLNTTRAFSAEETNFNVAIKIQNDDWSITQEDYSKYIEF